jgi:hypothetical protein
MIFQAQKTVNGKLRGFFKEGGIFVAYTWNILGRLESSSFEMCAQVQDTKWGLPKTNLTHYLCANILDLITE